MIDKWQQAYMDTAVRFGALSTAKRLQVGAIVVKDHRIISIGYNCMPSGWTNYCEDSKNYKTRPEVLHAEQNAIGKLARSSESGLGSEMYVTHSPCIECAKQIYIAGITKVYFKENYKSTDGIDFLRKFKIEVEQL
tara:strand:+ start:1849 stop:2256 length:408 start_codon:yes stop_codon:yes gene_type:complete